MLARDRAQCCVHRESLQMVITVPEGTSVTGLEFWIRQRTAVAFALALVASNLHATSDAREKLAPQYFLTRESVINMALYLLGPALR